MFKRALASLAIVTGFSGVCAAEDLTFTLTNSTSAVIDQFYASPVDTNDWEDDILGADILDAGDALDITIADGSEQCDYDMKFIFQDGDEVRENGINLCDTGTYTLSEE